ncbi:hypothetical protein BH09MYX1_BH09MYX1_16590 [soil metagenome]
MEKAVDSYRSSAWTLRDAHAPEGRMAELEARPMRSENEAAAVAARYVTTPASETERKVGSELLELERPFRYLGTKGESAGYGGFRLTDIFVDADETTYVSVRRQRSPIGLSRYYVLTLFDDGSCLETVARKKPIIRSSGPLTMRAGTGDLRADVASHLAVVRERAATGLKIIPIKQLDDVLRQSRHVVTHVTEPSVASGIAQTRANERALALQVVAVVVAAAVAVAFALAHAGH